MKAGDYVWDWEHGLWGLILEIDEHGYFILLYEDGEKGDSFENALSHTKDELCA